MLPGALRDPSWTVAILEYELISPTVHPGTLRDITVMNCLAHGDIQYFESTAARELFEFQVQIQGHVCLLHLNVFFAYQNTESTISRDYVRALRNVLNNGVGVPAVLCALPPELIYHLDQDGLHRVPQRPGRRAVLRTVHMRISSLDSTCAVH